MVVNLGDHADTAGAIYGQIAGAYYGKQAIAALGLQPCTAKAH
jgi:ADP-ribosyl-[dinitrogen reductase] hydrolase